MPRNPDLVAVQTYLKPEMVKRIDELAKRLRKSRSTMIAELLRAAVDDNERIIRIVTHPAMLKMVRKIVGAMGKDARERIPEGGEA